MDLEKIALLTNSDTELTYVYVGSLGDWNFNGGYRVYGKLNSLNIFENLSTLIAKGNRGTENILEGLNSENTTNLKKITYIDLTQDGISNFNELKFLTGVQTLILSNNVISDLEGIGNLKSIQGLYLNGNKLENLRELENLITTDENGNDVTTLRNLDVQSNSTLKAQAEDGFDNVALLNRLKNAGCTTINTDLNIN